MYGWTRLDHIGLFYFKFIPIWPNGKIIGKRDGKNREPESKIANLRGVAVKHMIAWQHKKNIINHIIM